ncbi:acyl carrier protein [Amycolatopsis panacis]|uniref:Acyl carrier protein n=1 Tax=Amycolatopsis panacis TaxID=2340917 RepID=A0A419HNT5_9PSEU|nr:acyl carrier protein [Amycolatopsis panacis]RJQ77859.1 acyl carrier protein [Amycolatopsis panacis]
MPKDIRAQIRAFITAKFPSMSFSDEEDIFALGFVNSLFAMELVMFLEKAFATRIPNEELTLDNFRTVARMAGLVERLAAASAAS